MLRKYVCGFCEGREQRVRKIAKSQIVAGEFWLVGDVKAGREARIVVNQAE